jgi:hypothetical protein
VRKTILALVVIGLLWAGYVAWPLYDLTALVRAIDARDVNTVAHYVNFSRLRASLTEQIVSAYVQMSGIQPSPLAQQAVVVGLSIADPVISKLISPEALSDLLAKGWPIGVIAEPPPSGSIGISIDTLGTAWQIFSASEYGIGRFEVSAPTVLPIPNRFHLTFRLLAWRWQLAGIALPENIRNLLANEVIKTVRDGR